MTGGVKIAVIDGPLPSDHPALVQTEAFCAPDVTTAQSPAAQHAAQVAAAILRGAPEARLLNYVIFPGRLSTSIATVCAALDRAAESEAQIVQCSFGTDRDAAPLAEAVARILARGKHLVASAPARGVMAYPAAQEGVIAVQGDARCAPDEWSWLSLPHAAFGACPMGTAPGIGGASIAAAHFTGLLAREVAAGREGMMAQSAAYTGRERILVSGEGCHDKL